jgi:hypothetical protein
MTSINETVVAIYDTQEQTEVTVRELQRSGFDMEKLSSVAKFLLLVDGTAEEAEKARNVIGVANPSEVYSRPAVEDRETVLASR